MSSVSETALALVGFRMSFTLQEDFWSQLTWALEGSQRLKHRPRSMEGLDLGPLHICTLLSSCGSPKQLEWGCLSLCCLLLALGLFPWAGLPCQASVGEDVPPALTWCTRAGGTPGGLPLLWGKEERVVGEGLWWWHRRKEEGCNWDAKWINKLMSEWKNKVSFKSETVVNTSKSVY